jgi:hypothetical protein
MRVSDHAFEAERAQRDAKAHLTGRSTEHDNKMAPSLRKVYDQVLSLLLRESVVALR